MPGAVELAQGYISLSVSTGGVGQAINGVFKDSARRADKHGEESGKNYSKGFNRSTQRLLDIGAFVAISAIVRKLAKEGMPDLSFGVSNVATKVTLITGALTAAAGAAAPLLALAGGIASAFSVAGVGVGAFAALVTPAFTGVFEATGEAVKAQEAYNAAVKAGDDKGAKKALDDRRAALSALTPAQRGAAEATIALRNAFVDQSKAFASPYLSAYTRGVKTLQGLLPDLTKIAKPAGEAVLRIFENANRAAKGPELKQFVDYMSHTVGPTIDKVASIGGDLGKTIINTLKAAAPIAESSLGVLGRIIGGLMNATEGPGLTKFFTDLEPVLGKISKLLFSAGRAVSSLISAAMPLAGPVLDALSQILDVLSKLFRGSDFQAFVTNIGTILKSLSPVFVALGKALGQVFHVLSDQLVAMLPDLVPALVAAAKAFGEILVGVSPLLPSLIRLVAVVVTGLLPALYPLITLLRKALVPVVDALTKGIQFALPYLQRLVASFEAGVKPGGRLRDIFGKIADFVKRELVPRFRDIGGAIRDMWTVVGPILKQLLDAFVGLVKDNLPAIKEAFKTVKDIVLAALEFIAARIKVAAAVISFIWDHLNKGVILGVVKSVFKTVITVIGSALKIILSVIKVATALMKGDWKGAWEGIKTIFREAGKIIKALVKNATDIIRILFSSVMDKIKEKVDARIKQVKDLFWSVVSYVKGTFKRAWDGVAGLLSRPINDAKTKIDTLLGKIKTAFSTTKDNIKKIWDGVKKVVNDPITWVKDKVYNGLLVPVWNRVADLVHGPQLKKYDRGGVHGVMPGYSPNIDNQIIAVGGGEAIMRPEFTRAVGKGFVDMANRIARTRGVQAVREFMNGGGQGFASGGVVGWLQDKLGSAAGALAGLGHKMKDWFLGGLEKVASAAMKPLRELIQNNLKGSGVADTAGKIANKALDLVLSRIRKEDAKATEGGGPVGPGGFVTALNWVKSQVGKPYIFGSAGPTGYDCSGLMAAIQNVIEGKNPYHRRYSTPSFVGSRANGFTRGKISPFMVGVNPAPGRFGHMAGTLNGVNVESAGGVGVRIGPHARGWNNRMFSWRGGLAYGGVAGDMPYDVVDPHGQHYDPAVAALIRQMGVRVKKFDSGGYLEPHSATLALNGTSQRERVGFDGAPPPSITQVFPASMDPMAAASMAGDRVVSSLRARGF